MKYLRFTHDGATSFGVLAEGGVIRIMEGNMFDRPALTGKTIPLDQVRLLPPTDTNTMVALWNNSTQQIVKLGRETPREALWFMKPASSFATHGDAIVYPTGQTTRVVLEGELGIVIGRTCRSVRPDEAASCIFGYTLINDVTAQDMVGRDPSFPQYTRAKGFDTFGLFGPVVETEIDPMTLRIQSFLNGRECQNYPVSDLVFSPHKIVEEISRTMTLRAGNIIACGTSLGVEAMQAGDTVEIRIDGIGTMVNHVVAP